MSMLHTWMQTHTLKLVNFTFRTRKMWRTKRWRIKRINRKAAAVPPALTIHRVRIQTEPEPSQAEPTDCQKCCWSEPWTQWSEPALHCARFTTRGSSPHCNTSTTPSRFTHSLYLCFFSIRFSRLLGFICSSLSEFACQVKRHFRRMKCAQGCKFEIPPADQRKGCRALLLAYEGLGAPCLSCTCFTISKESIESTWRNFLFHKGAKES